MPIRDPGVTEEYPNAMASRIVSRFSAPRPLEAFDFPDKGNINQHTFLIQSGSGENCSEFLLQRINQQVFTRPWTVMAAMIACLDSQRKGIEAGKIPPNQPWEVIQLIPTLDGNDYLQAENRLGTSYWRLMIKIPRCVSYKSLSDVGSRRDQLQIAEETGKGLAIFGDLTSTMDVSNLENPLPGYRDTRLYFDQFKSVLQENRKLKQVEKILPDDPVIRQSTEQHYLVHLTESEFRKRRGNATVSKYIDLILEQEDLAMTLLNEMDSGSIRRIAIHGDTKLDNFLFDSLSGKVKSLVDLDTIMPHTWLADWGDMVRSLSNIAGEKERDLSKIQVDLEVFEALAKGFLGIARSVNQREIDLMVDAVRIIALELGIRFLTDYLRGDTYFKLASTDPPDLNRVRGIAQLTLFERISDLYQEALNCIRTYSRSVN
jgi:hypothetical protein